MPSNEGCCTGEEAEGNVTTATGGRAGGRAGERGREGEREGGGGRAGRGSEMTWMAQLKL